MVENCDGKLRALGIYRATAHFARKMVEKWRYIREETKRKMALLKRKTRLGQARSPVPGEKVAKVAKVAKEISSPGSPGNGLSFFKRQKILAKTQPGI